MAKTTALKARSSNIEQASSNRAARRHPPNNSEPSRIYMARRYPRHWVSMAEAAEYLGVSLRTIRQLIADGKLTGYRANQRLYRVDLNEIDAMMQPFGGNVA